MSENAKKEETPKKDMKDVFASVENIKCVVRKSEKFVEEFLSEPMCGKCHPCALGSYEALVRLKRISAGVGEDEDVSALRRIAEAMLTGSRCIKGKDTAKFLIDALQSEAFKEHLEGKCLERECPACITYSVIAEKCIMCGLCQEACRHNAILGEKRKPFQGGYQPFEIRQKRCVNCGDCVAVCPTEAIIVVDVKSKEPVGV